MTDDAITTSRDGGDRRAENISVARKRRVSFIRGDHYATRAG